MIATTQAGVATAGYNYSTLFNPSTSGTNAIVKRIVIMGDAAAAAVYVPLTLRRVTGIQGGTQINNGAIPKKHNSSTNSKVNITYGMHNVTLAGDTNSRLLTLITPGAVGTAVAPQLTAHKEIVFSDDDPLVLRPGEGVTLYQEAVGDVDQRIAVYYEWQEAAAPTSNGDYMMYAGPISGNLSANFSYATLFNPLNSTKNYLVKRMDARGARTGTATAPAYINISVRRIMGASNGGGSTLFNGATIPKKDTNTGASTAEVRMGNVTVVLNGTTNHRLLGLTAPGAVGQDYGKYEVKELPEDLFLLKPGEGLVLYQETPAAGDINLKYAFGLVWNESAVPDVANPQWSNQSQTSNTVTMFGQVNLSAYGLDIVNLTMAWLATNETGVWQNWTNSLSGRYGSPINITSGQVNTWNQTNFTWSNSTIQGSTNVSWKIYYNDSSGNVNETAEMSFVISDAVGFTPMVGTIEFGTMVQGAANDTVTGGPMPFVWQNTGNINLNMTISATNLFSSAPNPDIYFQFKSANNETGSTLNAEDLVAAFTNMYAVAGKFAYNFKWQNENDEVRGHINMSVPSAENAGAKNSEVTFTGSKA